jgi:hypothetical protein
MQQQKLNFFEQIYTAVIKPKQYYRLTKISGGRLTGFVFLFTFIISLFTIIPMFYNVMGPNGFTQYVREDFPEFEMSNGELYVAQSYEHDDGHTYVLVDTNVDWFDLSDVDESYDQVILVSRTNIISYQSGRTQVFDFSDLQGLNFDNDVINAIIPFLYVILIVAAVFIYLFMVAGYYFTSLLYSLLGLVINSANHINLKYAALFKTAIYSKVTISILYALIDLTPLELPGLVRYGVAILATCAYVVFGTLSHASEEAYEEAGFPIPPNNY